MSHLEMGAVPLTSITTRVFLGQQIQCTQCHDHPSNDWKQADFWGINAFLKGIKTEEVRVEDAERRERRRPRRGHRRPRPTPSPASSGATPGWGSPSRPSSTAARSARGRTSNRREALAKFITEPSNDDFAKAFVNRIWGHFFGRGFVHPVDDFGAHNPPSHPELLDKLAAGLQGEQVRRQAADPLDHELARLYNLTSSANGCRTTRTRRSSAT